MTTRIGLRLIANIRLSHDTETTNAPEVQRADIQDYAEEFGHRVVAWTEDMDVSGAIPIRNREGIGPWLAEDRLDEWDGLIGARLDRLFRDQLDFLLWCRDFGDKYGKIIIDVEEGIDTSTRAGRRALNHRAETAEEYRMSIVINRGKAQKRIRQEARYGGGLIPFGYKSERYIAGERADGRTRYAHRLLLHEPYAKEMRAVVARILAGESANSICTDLNNRHVPTSRDAQRILQGKSSLGGVWQTNQLLRMLRSPALKGYVLNHPKKGQTGEPQIVRGPDGMPIRRPALIDDDTWTELQAELGKRGTGRKAGPRINAATLLLRVAYCGECGRNLHSESKGGRGKIRSYYGCSGRHYHGCTARMIPMDTLDNIVHAVVLSANDPEVDTVKELKTVTGNERDAKLGEVGQAIADLNDEYYVRRAIKRPDFDSMLAKLQAEYARLESLDEEETKTEWLPMGPGYTYADLWRQLDTQQRRRFLMRMGLRLFVTRDANDKISITRVETDPDHSVRPFKATLDGEWMASLVNYPEPPADYNL